MNTIAWAKLNAGRMPAPPETPRFIRPPKPETPPELRLQFDKLRQGQYNHRHHRYGTRQGTPA